MDTSKTSNPSGNSGEADDLIEEMARMMAAGAKDKNAGDKKQAPLRPASAPHARSQSDPQGRQGTHAPTLARTSPAPATRAAAPRSPAMPAAPAPASAAPSAAPAHSRLPESKRSSTPTGFGFSNTRSGAGVSSAAPKPANPAFPGLKPAASSQAAPAPAAPAPAAPAPTPAAQAPVASSVTETAPGSAAGGGFKFELGHNGVNPAASALPHSSNVPPGTTPSASAYPTNTGTATSALPPTNSTPSTPNSAPEAFSAAAHAAPLNDPIADLIRSQSQPEPAPPLANAPVPPQQNFAPPAQPAADPAQSETANTFASAPQSENGAAASDNFEVPPVFGLGGRPSEPSPVAPQKTPPPASSRPDALDEIESLIGNAVHVDFPQDATAPGDALAQNAVEKPHQAVPQSAPQVSQPHAGHPQSAHIASPRSDTNNNVDAAEAAILQAMGATTPLSQDASGPEPQMETGQDFAEESLLAGAQYEQKKQGRSRYIIPAVAVLFLAGAAGGGYLLLNSGAPDAEAPVLLADGSPSKETPVNPEPGNGDQSVIFNGLEGNTVPESEQQLLSRDQTDGATGNQVRQVITVDTTQEGLANRRVRTVTVRPDGTIINGDDAIAGGELLPVAQPNLPDLPQGAVNTQLADTTVAALPESPSLTATTIALPLSSSATTFNVDGASVPFPRTRLTDLERQSRVAVNSVAQSPTSNAQTPVVQGATNTPGAVDLIANIAADAVATPPATIPNTTTAPAQTQPLQPVTNPTSFVQMASLRRQDVADETAASLQTRYATALRGGQLTVKRVDLGDRGVFYRVLLPTASLNEASSVCRAIQNAGGDCFPRNN